MVKYHFYFTLKLYQSVTLVSPCNADKYGHSEIREGRKEELNSKGGDQSGRISLRGITGCPPSV